MTYIAQAGITGRPDGTGIQIAGLDLSKVQVQKIGFLLAPLKV